MSAEAMLSNLRPAADYERYARGYLTPWDELLVTRVKQLVAKSGTSSGRIVDIGTATGVLPLRLAEEEILAGYSICGIDPDPQVIEFATSRARQCGVTTRVEFALGDAHNLPWGEDTVLAALSRATLHHLADPCEALSEMYRVVQPGGFALVQDLRRDAPREALLAFASLREKSGYPSTHLEEKFTLAEAQDLVRRAGLSTCATVWSGPKGPASLGFEIIVRKTQAREPPRP